MGKWGGALEQLQGPDDQVWNSLEAEYTLPEAVGNTLGLWRTEVSRIVLLALDPAGLAMLGAPGEGPAVGGPDISVIGGDGHQHQWQPILVFLISKSLIKWWTTCSYALVTTHTGDPHLIAEFN